MTAGDHHHQTDPTKKITREQEGKEGYTWSLVYLRLCIHTCEVSCRYRCICACFETQKGECLKFITICLNMQMSVTQDLVELETGLIFGERASPSYINKVLHL